MNDKYFHADKMFTKSVELREASWNVDSFCLLLLAE